MSNEIVFNHHDYDLFINLHLLSKIELIKENIDYLGKKESKYLYDIEDTFRQVARAKIKKELYTKGDKNSPQIRLNKKSITIKIMNKKVAEYFTLLHRYTRDITAPNGHLDIVSRIHDFINLFEEETTNKLKEIIPPSDVLKVIKKLAFEDTRARTDNIRDDDTYHVYFNTDKDVPFQLELGKYDNEKEIINNFKEKGYNNELSILIDTIKRVEDIVLNSDDNLNTILYASYCTNSKALLLDLNKASLRIKGEILDKASEMSGKNLSIEIIKSVEEQLIKFEKAKGEAKEEQTVLSNTEPQEETNTNLSLDDIISDSREENAVNDTHMLSIEDLFGEQIPARGGDLSDATN